MINQTGKVYLVGAGLGEIGYLTIRARQLLSQAEVLVYDALVDAQLLDLVPNHCLKFDVGKRGGKPSTPQAEINQLLVEQCLRGKRVVRLKSGDPFIFGRVSAEIQALEAAKCAFEVVPGISSALAAPLLAGIPLTDAALSRCFAVLTAHEPDEINWQSLVKLETLVILMGGRQLKRVVERLLQFGRSPSTPIAIIRWAGTAKQQIWVAQLDNIVELTARERLSPAVIVVGEVVQLREYLQPQAWNMDNPVRSFKTKDAQKFDLPLSGKTILVTRAAGQSSEFSEMLQAQGAKTIEMPTLEIVPPSSWEPLDRAFSQLTSFNWLILTSSNGVDYFFERLTTLNRDIRALATLKIAVVGKKTAASLKQRGLQPDFIPPNFIADSLVEHFPEAVAGQKILFPRVETGGREVLVQEFTAKGAEVTEVPAYQSRCPSRIPADALEALQRQRIDAIPFTSSKTVKNFSQLLETAGGASLDRTCIASIGPQTSKTCRQLFNRVDLEAQEYTLEGLVQVIVRWAKT